LEKALRASSHSKVLYQRRPGEPVANEPGACDLKESLQVWLVAFLKTARSVPIVGSNYYCSIYRQLKDAEEKEEEE